MCSVSLDVDSQRVHMGTLGSVGRRESQRRLLCPSFWTGREEDLLVVLPGLPLSAHLAPPALALNLNQRSPTGGPRTGGLGGPKGWRLLVYISCPSFLLLSLLLGFNFAT